MFFMFIGNGLFEEDTLSISNYVLYQYVSSTQEQPILRFLILMKRELRNQRCHRNWVAFKT